MIKETLEMLIYSEHYNVSESVELAKGKYEIVTTWKGAFKKIKRIWLLKKR